jgi:fatty-acyl-CoA synthase
MNNRVRVLQEERSNMSVRDWNVGYIALKRAALTPGQTAFIYEDKPFTYRELNDNTNRIAHFLQERGVRKGDRISVLLRNCPEFLEVYFAAAKLGIIFVPLNFRLVGPELEYQLNNSGARLLVFHDSFVNTLRPILSSTKVEEDKFIFLKSGDSGAPECPEWALDYNELTQCYSVDEPQPDQPVGLDNPIAIMYTSGVTGIPKGVVLSHLQTFFKCFQNHIYFDMRADDVYLSQIPLFHSAGLFIVVTPTLCRGATFIMRRAFEPAQFAQDIERYKATIVTAFTTMWRFILQTKKLDEVDVSSVRMVHGGGERTPPSMFEELAAKGIHMQQGLGQTENSFMFLLPKGDIQRKMGSIGLPSFFTEAWIADKEGREVPPGEIGEIVAKGPTVMSGYWNMSEETEGATAGGVLHTRDLGYRDEEGYFYIVDRESETYRTGGENVYPAEVEKVLAQHPKIENVAIIGVPDEKWGETGKAFIVPKENEKLKKEDVLKFLEGKVAKYKFPTHVEFVDGLPLTASGKIKKAELKKDLFPSHKS